MIDNLFLCVGAQKAGTTWLHSQLENHEDISFSDVKEVHYFNTIHNGSILLTRRKVEHLERLIKNNKHSLERYFSDLSSGKKVDAGIDRLLSPVDDEWYMSLFSNKTGKYAADFSPEYALIGKEGFSNVKRISENQKIIYMMRDPISRAISAIKYYYKMHNTNISEVPIESMRALAQSNLILNMSMYDITIKELRSCFNQDQVLYMFYENVMANKQESIDTVCNFLDISKVSIPEAQLSKRVNVTEDFDIDGDIISLLREKLANTYVYMKQEFKLPEKWYNDI